MKYTIAIAALLGFVSADDTTKVWELRSVLDHRTDSTVQAAYGDHSVKSANARPPLRSWVEVDSSDSSSSSSDSDIQLGDDDVDHSGEPEDATRPNYKQKYNK